MDTSKYVDLHRGHNREYEIRVSNACEILKRLPLSNCRSLIDVGAGTGAMLTAFIANGFGDDVKAIDGDWALKSVSDNLRSKYEFRDLEQPLAIDRKYDVAVCLEVAEHLSPRRGPSLVTELCLASDLVIFSAAVPGQGGVGHINEQKASYWVELFASNGFVCFDELRFSLPKNSYSWFRQNLLIFARNQSNSYFGSSEVFGVPTFKGDYYAAEIMDEKLKNLKVFETSIGQCLQQGRSALKVGNRKIVLSVET